MLDASFLQNRGFLSRYTHLCASSISRCEFSALIETVVDESASVMPFFHSQLFLGKIFHVLILFQRCVPVRSVF